MTTRTTVGDPRRTTRNAIIVGIRISAALFSTVLSTRFALQALGAEVFGAYMAAASLPLGLGFLTGAMIVSTQRGLAMGGRATDRNRLFNIALVLHAGVALVILSTGLAVGGWFIDTILDVSGGVRESSQVTLKISLAAAAIGAVLAPYEALLQADDRFGLFAALDVLRSVGLVTGTYLLQSYDGDRLTAYAAIVSSATVLSAAIGAALSRLGHHEAKIHPRLWIDRKSYGDQLSIFLWTIAHSLAVVGRTQGFVMLTTYFFGTLGAASFGISNQIVSALRQICGTLTTVTSPSIYRAEGSGRREEMIRKSLTISKYSSLITIGLAAPLLAELGTITKIWLGSPPPDLLPITILLFLSYLIDQLSSSVWTAQMAIGRIGASQTVSGLVILLVLPIAYLLGMTGNSITVVISTLALASAVVTLSRVKLLDRHHPDVFKCWMHEVLLPISAVIAPALAVPFLLAFFLPPSNASLVITFLFCWAALCLSSYTFALSSHERLLVRTYLIQKTVAK